MPLNRFAESIASQWNTKMSFNRIYLTPPSPLSPLPLPAVTSNSWPRARILVQGLLFIALLLGIGAFPRLTQCGLVIVFAVAIAGRHCRSPSQVAVAGEQVAQMPSDPAIQNKSVENLGSL